MDIINFLSEFWKILNDQHFQEKSLLTNKLSSDITSRTQQLIGCKWRIDWFHITYNQSAVGSMDVMPDDIVVMHIMDGKKRTS